ncbi:MAG: molybdopterin molybdotransferase MoeA [Coriobacteriia bacterium]|nr:molybdopterin molybdotransferase MoeA [Coriobacteriia bacterium]
MAQPPNPKTPLSVEQARDILLEQVKLLPPERVSLVESYGRVLAQDIVSDMDISPFDNSGMDGFAVRFADFEAAVPTADNPLTLEIVGIIAAGEVYVETLQPGQALRIMTGAPLPQGADTVVKLEDVTVLGQTDKHPEGSTLVCTRMPKYQQHVRRKAEEARKGDVLLRCGDRISAPGAGLLASTGNAELMVYRRPRVAIISTGSELVPVDTLPGPGQIRNSNSYSLAAAVIDAGGIPTILPSVEDTLEALCAALTAALVDHDFVITSGGAADGDFDFITLAVRELGELFYNKVNMKPGKSQIFGLVAGTPVFGLPGNPGAASVGFEVLIRPALRRMQGITQLDRPLVQAALVGDMRKPPDARRCYLRAQLSRDEDGRYLVAQDANQSSALLGALNRSNCLLIVREGQAAPLAGDPVDCLRLDVEEGTL